MSNHRKHLPKIEFDFNKPADARRFLRGLKMQNLRVLEAHQADGSKIVFETATDNQAMDIASQLYIQFYTKGLIEFEEELLQ